MTSALKWYGGLNVRLPRPLEETETSSAYHGLIKSVRCALVMVSCFMGLQLMCAIFLRQPREENHRVHDQSHFQDVIRYHMFPTEVVV